MLAASAIEKVINVEIAPKYCNLDSNSHGIRNYARGVILDTVAIPRTFWVRYDVLLPVHRGLAFSNYVTIGKGVLLSHSFVKLCLLLGVPFDVGAKIVAVGIVFPAAGVGVFERVVEHVGVAVEGLGVARLRHHRIRADEPAQGGVVEAGAVIIQPYCTLPALACKAVVGGQGGVGGAASAVGVVALLALEPR